MTFSRTMVFLLPRGGYEPPTGLSLSPIAPQRERPPCRRSIDPAVPSFPIGLAQFAPQDFPGDVARDSNDEIDRLRRLEMCDARVRPRDDVGRILRGAGL